MRQGIRLTPRVSEPQHYCLQPWDLEYGQVIIIVDYCSRLPTISIICTFVMYENDRITVLVANDLLKYLYPDYKGSDAPHDMITFVRRDIWIHPCTD